MAKILLGMRIAAVGHRLKHQFRASFSLVEQSFQNQRDVSTFAQVFEGEQGQDGFRDLAADDYNFYPTLPLTGNI